MTITYEEMTEQFQCPGCGLGSNIKCGNYEYDDKRHSCKSHVLATMVGFINNYIALGLPKGFNKPGLDQNKTSLTKMNICFSHKDTAPEWNHLNVPVWALEQDGFLFVRTYSPRLNIGLVDVIEGGTLSMVPQAINVADFINEID